MQKLSLLESHVDLRKWDLKSEGHVQLVTRWLQTPPAARTLDLRDCALQPAGAAEIGIALTGNHHLEGVLISREELKVRFISAPRHRLLLRISGPLGSMAVADGYAYYQHPEATLTNPRRQRVSGTVTVGCTFSRHSRQSYSNAILHSHSCNSHIQQTLTAKQFQCKSIPAAPVIVASVAHAARGARRCRS